MLPYRGSTFCTLHLKPGLRVPPLQSGLFKTLGVLHLAFLLKVLLCLILQLIYLVLQARLYVRILYFGNEISQRGRLCLASKSCDPVEYQSLSLQEERKRADFKCGLGSSDHCAGGGGQPECTQLRRISDQIIYALK